MDQIYLDQHSTSFGISTDVLALLAPVLVNPYFWQRTSSSCGESLAGVASAVHPLVSADVIVMW
jgi:hypothetical protein